MVLRRDRLVDSSWQTRNLGQWKQCHISLCPARSRINSTVVHSEGSLLGTFAISYRLNVFQIYFFFGYSFPLSNRFTVLIQINSERKLYLWRLLNGSCASAVTICVYLHIDAFVFRFLVYD